MKRFIPIFLCLIFNISPAFSQSINFDVTHIDPAFPNSGAIGLDVLVNEGNSNNYQFIWTGPAGYYSDEQDISGLFMPGEYCVVVLSDTDCVVGGCIDVYESDNVGCLEDPSCLLSNFSYDSEGYGCGVYFTNQSIGAVSNYFWLFGDGASSFSENPYHLYSEPGEYTVSLTVFNDDDQSNTYIIEFTQTCGNDIDDFYPEDPECLINGPNTVTTGDPISLTAAAIGNGPFEFNWVLPLGLQAISGTNNETIVFTADDVFANNGDDFTLYVEVSNFEGGSETCFYTVGVTGNDPGLELHIFDGSSLAEDHLLLVAFYDGFEIPLPWNYAHTFTITNLLPQVTFQDESITVYDHDLGICHPNLTAYPEPEGRYVCLPDSEYEICVSFAANGTTYNSCKNITVGTPPPPLPGIDLVNYSNPDDFEPVEITSGENECALISYVLNDDFYPYSNEYTSGCFQQFVIEYTLNNPVTGFNTSIYVNSTDLECNPALDEYYFSVCPDMLGCEYGTIEVTAKFYLATSAEYNPTTDQTTILQCCEGIELDEIAPGVWEPLVYEVLNPFYINYYPSLPTIEEIKVEGGCEPYLVADIKGGCRSASNSGAPCFETQFYSEYEWRIFDINTNEEIQDLLIWSNNYVAETDKKCVKINTEHPYFENFENGELASIRCQLAVEDVSGFGGEMIQVVSFPLPLRMNLPNDIMRCPGAITPLLGMNAPLVTGGDGQHSITWTGSTEYLDVNDFGSPNNPMLIIPETAEGEIFELDYLLTNGAGCFITGSVTVTVSSMAAVPFAQEVGACNSGPGINTLGVPIVTGGSGVYSYSWSPTDYLDDPTKADPLIMLPQGSSGVTYILTVTDEFGCSASTEPVNVIGLSASPTADAGADKVVCFSEDAQIGNNADLSQNYLWTSNHPDFQGSTDANPVLPSVLSEVVGTYNYVVKGIEPLSGCYAEDDVDVLILNQMLYSGYESDVIFGVKGEPAKLWSSPSSENIFYTSNPLGEISGTQFPISEINWSPDGSNESISAENNGIPSDGSFVPTWINPHSIMEVIDKEGCTQQVITNRVLLLKKEPIVKITPLTGQGDIAGCQGELACFRVLLKTNFYGFNKFLLPSKISTPYSIMGYQSDGNLGLEAIELDNGSNDLELIDSDEGVYSGTICYNHPEGYTYLEYGLITESILPSNFSVDGHYSFNIGVSAGVSASAVFCDVEYPTQNPNLPPSPIIFCQEHRALELIIEPTELCEETNIGEFGFPTPEPPCDGMARFEGGSEGFVLINGGFNAEEGAYLKAYINPCLVEEESPMELIYQPTDKAIPENIKQNKAFQNKLSIQPNPFTSEITITYEIETENIVDVRLRLVSSTGKEITMLVSNEKHSSGKYTINFDAADLPLGIYYYELIVDKSRFVEKVVKISRF